MGRPPYRSASPCAGSGSTLFRAVRNRRFVPIEGSPRSVARSQADRSRANPGAIMPGPAEASPAVTDTQFASNDGDFFAIGTQTEHFSASPSNHYGISPNPTGGAQGAQWL